MKQRIFVWMALIVLALSVSVQAVELRYVAARPSLVVFPPYYDNREAYLSGAKMAYPKTELEEAENAARFQPLPHST